MKLIKRIIEKISNTKKEDLITTGEILEKITEAEDALANAKNLYTSNEVFDNARRNIDNNYKNQD